MSSRTVPIDLLQASIWFAQRRGWEVEDMLRQAGVSPALLAEGRSRVTEEQLTEFVQQLWRQTDDEMFGLGAHPLPRGSFRLLSYGLIGAKDLAGLLDRFHGLVRAMPAIPPLTVEQRRRPGPARRWRPPVTADRSSRSTVRSRSASRWPCCTGWSPGRSAAGSRSSPSRCPTR